jgi:demethylmenaquinone methyltransferase / 2-methoxy-6-polyprenyl-1,4-benzoquinol methylase
MGNKFYDPAQRAAKVRELFSRIAPRYDLINDLQSFGLHRYWKRQLVRHARVQPGETALDLCCGTGDVARALAAAGAQVTGLDFSFPMLELAAKRAPAPASANTHPSATERNGIPFLCADAQQLPFPDASFDVITISYGLRNLASLETGLREMWRVARPGGRLLVLDFGVPDRRIWRAIYFGYLRRCVPIFGRLFCGDADTHAYILESLLHYRAQHGVAAAMHELGCEPARIISLLGGIMTINYGEKPRAAGINTAGSLCARTESGVRGVRAE